MGIFLKKILAFSLLMLIANAVFLLAISHFDWNFAKRIEALRLIEPGYEYLVIGNSLAMDGIDTEALSSETINAYNLSMGGASIKTNLIQLNEYLAAASNYPKVVILGVGSFLDSIDSDRINPIVEFTMKDYRYGLNDFPMIKFRWLAVEMIKKIISPQHRQADIVQGQLRIKRVVPDHTRQKTVLPAFSLSHLTDSEYISTIAALCHEKGILLIIVEMPGFEAQRNGSPVGPYRLTMKGGINVDVYNFNHTGMSAVIDADTDWLGDSHLNQAGARKFTLHVKQMLDL